MLSRVNRVLAAIAGASLLLSAPAAAQTAEEGQGVDVELFQPATSSSGFFTQDSALVLGNMQLNVGATFDLAKEVLVARDPATGEVITNGEIVDDRVGLHITAGLGLFDFLEVGLAVPVVLSQDGNLAPVGRGMDELASSSLGDVRLFAKARLAGTESLSFGLGVIASLPTGDPENFTGNDGAAVNPKAILTYAADRFAVSANVGYRIRGETIIRDLEVDDELTAGLAAQVAVVPRLFSIIGETYFAGNLEEGRMPGAVALQESRSPAEAIVGGRYIIADTFALQGGVGFGLTQGYGSPSVRGILGLAYAPLGKKAAIGGPADTDGDGILDDVDQCPTDPEDKDDFEDEDGCPEPDNDKDGIVDASDKCPLVAGPPENQGCPDEDKDGDGIVDRLDKCPTDPEDKDGFQDEDGCPDLDNDGDGIADATDKCPDVAEDFDKFEDEDGCPERDNDGDGILDEADKCPLEAETFNGNEDDDGCPDKGAVLVVLQKDRIEIKQQIFFATNKATIKKRSFPLLSTVAKILILHPEIKKVRIEGHTDYRGSNEYNLKLSQARAESVRNHLINVNGVEADRLEAQGFGEERPLEQGRSRKAMAKNRRVDFIIVDRAE